MERGEENEEDDAGPFEEVGVLRLPLKPGTASGYVGVQRSASKKRPWQATLTVPGRGRLNVGQFQKPLDAAVARAQAKLTNGNFLLSPRKQAARNSGLRSPTRNAYLGVHPKTSPGNQFTCSWTPVMYRGC